MQVKLRLPNRIPAGIGLTPFKALICGEMLDCGNTVPRQTASAGFAALIFNETRAAQLLLKTVQFTDKSVNHLIFDSFGWSSFAKKAEMP